MNKWVEHSYPMRLGGAGPCHICGQKYGEGWLDEMANPTCNDCKLSMYELDDQELLDAVSNEDIVSILTRLDFPIFEIREGWFDA